MAGNLKINNKLDMDCLYICYQISCFRESSLLIVNKRIRLNSKLLFHKIDKNGKWIFNQIEFIDFLQIHKDHAGMMSHNEL